MNRTAKGTDTVAKTAVHTDRAPQPAGPYSQGIVANGLLYIMTNSKLFAIAEKK